MFDLGWDGGEGSMKRYRESEKELLIEKSRERRRIKNMETENIRLKELNQEMYKALSQIGWELVMVSRKETDSHLIKAFEIINAMKAKAERGMENE